MKSPIGRNIASGALAGGVFASLFLLMSASLPLSLGLGAAAYLSGMFLFRSKEKEMVFVYEGITAEHVREVIRVGRKKVANIRLLGHRTKNREVKADIFSICDTADAIFSDFKEDPKDIKAARKFLSYYLDTTEKILVRYVSIQERGSTDENVLNTLRKTENVLKLLDDTFKLQMEKLLEDDVLDLDVEIQLLEKTIKSEGI